MVTRHWDSYPYQLGKSSKAHIEPRWCVKGHFVSEVISCLIVNNHKADHTIYYVFIVQLLHTCSVSIYRN